MKQVGALMVWDDLKHTAIEPNIREGINQLAGISEEVKKVRSMLPINRSGASAIDWPHPTC